MDRALKAVAAMMLMMFFAVGCNKPIEPSHGDDANEHNGHGYVDMGLPSGILWATCNVGADTPEGFGDYLAWGETAPKDIYDWKSYRYGNFRYDRYELNKYCTDSCCGLNGFMDELSVLEPSDDAARACWGGDWRIPTIEEWEELFQNTTGGWMVQNGVKGWLLTATNGNSLFLPAAGYWWGAISMPTWDFTGQARSKRFTRIAPGVSISIRTAPISAAAATATAGRWLGQCAAVSKATQTSTRGFCFQSPPRFRPQPNNCWGCP